MLPTEPTAHLQNLYPNARIIRFTSPESVPEEECGTVVGLAEHIQGGIFDGGPLIHTFWKPSEEELEALKAGAIVELDFYDTTMPMTAMNVEYPFEIQFSTKEETNEQSD